MSWSLPLKRTMPSCFSAASQAAKPALCLRRPAATEFTSKHLLAVAVSPLNQAPILRIELAAFRKTRVPLMDPAAVLLKSP
jgi:hypothetical protein